MKKMTTGNIFGIMANYILRISFFKDPIEPEGPEDPNPRVTAIETSNIKQESDRNKSLRSGAP